MEACGSKPSAADDSVNWMAKREKDEIRVMRKAVQDVFERCQRALELLNEAGNLDERDVDRNLSKGTEEDDTCHDSSETDEIYDMIKSQVVGPEFLQKIVNAQASVHLNTPEGGSSWDMIYETDLWEGGNSGLEQEDYVLVRKEDIVEGITCFMAEYLLSLEQTKDLTPNQLQDALRKTFSLKKRKGKLRKAWDGSKVIYNVASWSATAIGIYQNPVLFSAASTAFWTSCRVLSKFF